MPGVSYLSSRLSSGYPSSCFPCCTSCPGDPLAGLLPLQSGPAEREQLARELGFDKPVIVQYGKWLGKAIQGDLGRSLTTNRPIGEQVIFALREHFHPGDNSGRPVHGNGGHTWHNSWIPPRTLAGQAGQRAGHYRAEPAKLLGSYHTYHHLFRRTWRVAVPGHEHHRRVRIQCPGRHETHGHTQSSLS